MVLRQVGPPGELPARLLVPAPVEIFARCARLPGWLANPGEASASLAPGGRLAS